MTRASGRRTDWLTLTLCVAAMQVAVGCGSSGGQAGGNVSSTGGSSTGGAPATGGVPGTGFVGSADPNGPATVDGVAFPPTTKEGHGGDRISQISSLIAASMTTNKPNIILLMIGTNDVGTSTTPIGTPGAQNIADRLGILVDKITGQDPKVDVQAAPHRRRLRHHGRHLVPGHQAVPALTAVITSRPRCSCSGIWASASAWPRGPYRRFSRADNRAFFVGALLPDLIDKPLYYGWSWLTGKHGADAGLISGTHLFGHTGVFLLALVSPRWLTRAHAVAGAGDGRGDPPGAGLRGPVDGPAHAGSGHCSAGNSPVTLQQPDRAPGHVFRPVTFAGEVVGAAILWWDYRAATVAQIAAGRSLVATDRQLDLPLERLPLAISRSIFGAQRLLLLHQRVDLVARWRAGRSSGRRRWR